MVLETIPCRSTHAYDVYKSIQPFCNFFIIQTFESFPFNFLFFGAPFLKVHLCSGILLKKKSALTMHKTACNLNRRSQHYTFVKPTSSTRDTHANARAGLMCSGCLEKKGE